MAKIYFNRYKSLIDNGTMTLDEAVESAKANVPERWRNEVVSMLESLRTH